MNELVNPGTREKGVTDMRALAERQKGTTLGAHALATAGVYSEDDALYRQLLQQIISEYPNSTFSMQAQIALFNLTPQPTLVAWMSSRDQLLQGFGAPTKAEIMRNRRAAVKKVRALPQDTFEAVMQIYFDYAGVLRQSQRYREVIEVCQFGNEATFKKGIQLQFGGTLGYCFDLLNGGSHRYDVVTVDPKVKLLAPSPNRKSGPRPQFSIDVRSGDWVHSQLTDITITLDGQDVTAAFEQQTKLNLKRKTGANVYYQIDRFSYRPSQSLRPGSHTLAVSAIADTYHASEGGPGKTNISWSFFVDSRERDEGPEDDDLGCNEEKD
jgi:hypothetical protein